MERDHRPVLVTNPIDDREFSEAASRLLDEGFLAIDDFRQQLRVAYPDAAVHRRDIVAESILIWYVYRDGRWVNAQPKTGQSGASSVDDQLTR